MRAKKTSKRQQAAVLTFQAMHALPADFSIGSHDDLRKEIKRWEAFLAERASS